MKKILCYSFLILQIAGCSVDENNDSITDLSAVRDHKNNILGIHQVNDIQGKPYFRLLVCRSSTPDLTDSHLVDTRYCRNPFLKDGTEYLFGEIPRRGTGAAVSGYIKGSVGILTIVAGSISVGLGGGAFLGSIAASSGLSAFAGASTGGALAGLAAGGIIAPLGAIFAWVSNNVWGHGDRAAFHHWDEIFTSIDRDDHTKDNPEVDIKKVLKTIGEDLGVEPNFFL